MKKYEIQPISPSHTGSTQKERLFLTTIRIDEEQIWANGLFQNVLILYKMFESMGYEPWLLVETSERKKDSKLQDEYRTIDFKTYTQNPFRVIAYMEVAMSCDPGIRAFFRNMGAKITKTYLGNILNIDIETVTFYNGVNFAHHVAGEIDEIFVSPHYDIHEEYAGSVNGLFGKTRIVPYVWDPIFIRHLGHVYDDSSLRSPSRTFVIMEPNISFQKCALIPILAMEAYFRKHPEHVETVIVVNGQKLKENPYFMSSVAPCLSILQKGKLQLMPRTNIVNIAKAVPHAIVLQHQVNNAYNYSFLEWLTMGFPLVHNVPQFQSYGYYYKENDFLGASEQISFLLENHNKEVYASHATQLGWQLSIHNPANREVWKNVAFPFLGKE